MCWALDFETVPAILVGTGDRSRGEVGTFVSGRKEDAIVTADEVNWTKTVDGEEKQVSMAHIIRAEDIKTRRGAADEALKTMWIRTRVYFDPEVDQVRGCAG